MNNRKSKKRKTENPLRELFGAINFHEPTKAILKELRKNESGFIEKNINELDKKIKSAATKRFLKVQIKGPRSRDDTILMIVWDFLLFEGR